MIVKELIKLLLELEDQDRLVVIPSYGGNCYSPFDGTWEGTYLADNSWSGEMHVEKDEDGSIPKGYGEEDLCEHEDAVPALVLCPIN